MLYWKAPVPPVAIIFIVPFAAPQSVGLADVTLLITGKGGSLNVMIEVHSTGQVVLEFRTQTS
mgnify:FL=1